MVFKQVLDFTAACENITTRNASKKKCRNCKGERNTLLLCTECTKTTGHSKSSHIALQTTL